MIHVDGAEDYLLSTDVKPQENHDFHYNPPTLPQASEISTNQSLSEEEPTNPLALNPTNSLLARSSFQNPFLSKYLDKHLLFLVHQEHNHLLRKYILFH